MIMSCHLVWRTEIMILVESLQAMMTIHHLHQEKKGPERGQEQLFQLMPLEQLEAKAEQDEMVILDAQVHLDHQDYLAIQDLRVCQDLPDPSRTFSHISIKYKCPKEKTKDQIHS